MDPAKSETDSLCRIPPYSGLRSRSPGPCLDTNRAHTRSRVYSVRELRRACSPLIRGDSDPPEILGGRLACSPISPSLLQRAAAVFRCDFIQYYGATETTGEVTCLGPDDHRGTRSERLRSCGRPLPGVELRIVASDGRELPAGEVGEIQVRTASLMKGYWNLPDATADALVDGWYRTGDAAFRDDEGYVTIVDRLKDMVVTGGENVYTAEVEAALFLDPAVADVAVIGVPDPRWGEAVKGVVVPRPGGEKDAGAILARLRGRLASYKIPKSIDFVEALPRNASGKILKRELRAPYWKDHDRGVA